MSKVLLIRHAQSENNAKPESQRVCDPGITEMGWQQAGHTAQALLSHNIRRLYCSPFLRSIETTQPIAKAKQLVPIIRADLFEEGGCYSGHLPGEKKGEAGMGSDELQRRFPGWQIDSRIRSDGWWGQDYESTEAAMQRAERVRCWIESEVVTDCESLDVFVIHADFKYHLLNSIFGVDFSDQLNSHVGPLFNTSLTLLEIRSSSWKLISLNSVLHLPAEKLTC